MAEVRFSEEAAEAVSAMLRRPFLAAREEELTADVADPDFSADAWIAARDERLRERCENVASTLANVMRLGGEVRADGLCFEGGPVGLVAHTAFGMTYGVICSRHSGSWSVHS